MVAAGGVVVNEGQVFATDAANYEEAFLKPTVGWISGVHLSQLGSVTPKVYDGRTATKYEDRAVVAYVALPEDKLASLEIVNLFEPGDGDVLHFDQTSFEVNECEVNGRKVNFAEYVRSKGLEHGALPLVGDFAAAFRTRLTELDDDGVVMSCNCILNFLFGELEGKAIGGVEGPVTFGEIAYQLLNQTMVMVRLQ